MSLSAEPISAQRGGIPLNCREKLSPRNMADPLQLLYTLDASPDSPLLLATRTGPQVPCSNPQNGLAHSTCRWSFRSVHIPCIIDQYSSHDPPSRSRSCIFRHILL